jgi:hypothetical protein
VQLKPGAREDNDDPKAREDDTLLARTTSDREGTDGDNKLT